jgi:hypothetical protein
MPVEINVSWLWGLLSLSVPLTTWADLSWESKSLEFSPTCTDTKIEAHFKFKNAGTQTVTIGKVTSSCNCTTATVDKKTYAAGESGEIVATFKFVDRVGRQEKKIVVETSDPKEPPTMLTLRVTIPNPVQIHPTFVFWKADEDLKPKTFHLEALNGFEIATLKVSSTDDKLGTEIQTIESGKHYEISVLPHGARAVAAMLRININEGQDNAKVYLVHVRVY